MLTQWLTDTEVLDLCAPLRQSAAQSRFLKTLGLTVRAKPNGRPIVIRDELTRVMSSNGAQISIETTPNEAALMTLFSKKKRKKSVL